MRLTTPLVLVISLVSLTGCGGGDSSSSTSPTTTHTAASIAPTLSTEINTSFIAAMGAGMPLASLDRGRAESWLVMVFESLISQPVLAQAAFVGSCSRGGTVRVEYQGAAPVGRGVTLVNTPVIFSSCAHVLNGEDITASGTLMANGAWAAAVPASPVRLSGDLTVNQIGAVAINGSTGASFSGQVGGITVGTPAPAPTPINLTGRWVGVAPDGMIIEPGPGACDLEFDLRLDLTSSGGAFTGTATTTLRKLQPGAVECDPIGAQETWPPLINGVVGSATISFSLPNPGGGGGTIDFSGTVTDTRMTGTLVTFGGARRGSFTLIRS